MSFATIDVPTPNTVNSLHKKWYLQNNLDTAPSVALAWWKHAYICRVEKVILDGKIACKKTLCSTLIIYQYRYIWVFRLCCCYLYKKYASGIWKCWCFCHYLFRAISEKRSVHFSLHQSGLKSESTFGNIMCWVIFLVSSVMVVLVKLLDTSTGIAALRVRSERKLIGMRLSYSIPCAHKGFLLLKPAIINWKV